MSIGFALVLVISAAVYLRVRHRRPPPQTAYAAGSHITLWNTTADVREPVTTVDFGDRLVIVDRFEHEALVRTARGATGWLNERDLLSAELWDQMRALDATAGALPIEAHGRTHVLSNLHIEPARSAPRICQLGKEIPADLLERRAVDVPAKPSETAAGAGDENEASPASEPAEAKKEDWWLIRAHVADRAPLSGWVLGRFLELDVPAPLPNYMAAADVRIVAWFVLNQVAAKHGESDTTPQYLVVGVRGAEGQPCDFTLLRVFTWSERRQRYETAFVESDLCGSLPVKLAPAAAMGGDVTFSFSDASNGAPAGRVYHMHETVVRRERSAAAGAAAR